MFKLLLTQPFFNALIIIYNFVHDMGLAIILLTILIRVILYPLFYKMFKNQSVMQKIQPEILEIQKTYKDEREKQAMMIMEVYKKYKVNPFSGILMIFIQIPILIALYQVFLHGISDKTLVDLYTFVAKPSEFNNTFLGLINVTDKNMIIVILAVICQYFQGLVSMPKIKPGENNQAANIAKQMLYIGPVLTLFVLFNLPAAMGLYWLTTSIFSIFQQLLINKHLLKTGQV